jgi:hypothetical protein
MDTTEMQDTAVTATASHPLPAPDSIRESITCRTTPIRRMAMGRITISFSGTWLESLP